MATDKVGRSGNSADPVSSPVQGVWASTEELLPPGTTDPVMAVRSGLPYAVCERINRILHAPSGLLARTLSISERTLHRRKKEGQFTSAESDRLLLLAEVVRLAVEALGGTEEAQQWLANPHSLLSGESPLEHMDTVAGVEEIRSMLYHIEYSMPV